MMKNYASRRAGKGKTAYRTPSRFIYNKTAQARKVVPRTWDLASRLEHRRVKGKRNRG